jgi:hypothetical protein
MLRTPGTSGLLRVVLLVSLFGSLATRTYGQEPWPKGARDAVESLAKQMLTRLDQAEAARTRRSVAETASKVARAALDGAERDRNVAEIALHEYADGILPQTLQNLRGELQFCESELDRSMRLLLETENASKAGQIKAGQLIAAKMAAQKAEIKLQNAKLSLDVQLKFSGAKEMERLETEVKKAKTGASLKLIQEGTTSDALAAAKREEVDAKLSGAEAKAMSLLNETMDLYDSGKAEPGEAKLIEAQEAWRDAQAERAKARLKTIKLRLKMAAESVQPAK